ncbi:MAG: aldose 1-epimerase family protein [Lachnospiraceae bacterium]|nr:aldose 1-epimerase family protein [Lachnospiraceae bacterium]
MKIYELKNKELIVKIKSVGAELTSISDALTQMEYLWCGDAKYWGRQSPVLFPIVGNVKNKEYRWKGKTYPMGQHGFARDMEFCMTKETADEIWFVANDDEETRKRYPFSFALHIGYKLKGRKVTVMWRVENKEEEKLPFSIGAHPAFSCPPDENGRQTDCYLITDAKQELIYGGINMETGMLIRGIQKHLPLDEDGAFRITEHLFDEDALVIEGEQVHTLSLAGADKKPYVTVHFDMPLCGIWSPAKKNAPFICLEPWCGRCDAEDFDGEFDEREYGIVLGKGEEFCTSYDMCFAVSENKTD